MHAWYECVYVGAADPPRVLAHLQVMACAQDPGLCVYVPTADFWLDRR